MNFSEHHQVSQYYKKDKHRHVKSREVRNDDPSKSQSEQLIKKKEIMINSSIRTIQVVLKFRSNPFYEKW